MTVNQDSRLVRGRMRLAMSDRTNLKEANKMNSSNNCQKLILSFSHSISRLVMLVVISFFSNLALAEQADETVTAAKIFDLVLDEDEKVPSQDSEEAAQSATPAEPVEDNRTTAEKLEDLKEDVLAVNRDLFILEEDLLFPASTQLATYFSVDIGYFFSLDNIKIKIDDEQVTHHLYTEKDVDALYRGAIQKVFVGNVSTGEHELVVILIGIGPHKREYRRALAFEFTKTTEAKAIEIQLRDDSGKLQPKLNVVEW